jgi:hypothetical protein
MIIQGDERGFFDVLLLIFIGALISLLPAVSACEPLRKDMTWQEKLKVW